MEDSEQSEQKHNTKLPESISKQLYENNDQKPEVSKQPPAKPISEVINAPSKQKQAEPKPENPEAIKENNQKSVKSDKQKKSPATTIAIVLAILVMIGLSAVAVYSYMSSSNESSDSANSSQSEANKDSTINSETANTDADKKQLEEAVEEIDQLPSGSDDTGENISDQDIGL